jgi:signal peptidase I
LKSLREISETAITAVLIFVVLQMSTQSFRVDGHSMDPTMSDNQHVLVNKFVYASADAGIFGDILHAIKGEDEGRTYLFHGPQRDDVIVFKPPTGPDADFLVKRVIGIPGDEIDIRGGRVWVNGEPRDEMFPVTKSIGGTYPLTVEEDKFFMLGDNRSRSNDSRTWGQLPAENVVGRVWFGYWPPSEISLFSSVGSAVNSIIPGNPVKLVGLFR